MAATSLAILGKDNEPLYVREFGTDEYTGNNFSSVDDLFDFPSLRLEGQGNDSDGDNSISRILSTTSIPSTSPASIRQQFIMHAALDRLDQLSGPPPGYGWRNRNGSSDGGMFVGLLCPAEDQRVYGYVTTTKIKFILVTEDDGIPIDSRQQRHVADESIKMLLRNVHDLYIQDMMNPFKIIGTPITSKRFDERLQELIQSFNNSDGMI